MRRLLAPLCAAAGALALTPAAASATDGGAFAPDASGGAGYRQTLSRLTTRRFAVSPAVRTGAGATITYRIEGAPDTVRVRVDVLRGGHKAPALRLDLGTRRTGRTYSTRRTLVKLTPGAYTVRLHASDGAGRRLARTSGATGRARLQVLAPPAPKPAPTPAPTPAPAPAPAPAPVGAGRFPVRGAYTYGGDGARFGADRGGRLHRGQDLLGAEGTPLVSPVSGAIYFKAYQAGGAGHYVVVRGDDGRDYVFMHMVAPTPLAKGARVAAGQQVGQLGNTGSSSAPHLHFEIWPNGWYAPGSEPIDPRPQLEAWARG